MNFTISHFVYSMLSLVIWWEVFLIRPVFAQDASPTTDSAPTSVGSGGTPAQSSARSLSRNILVITPIWQDFIDHPTKEKADDVSTKVKKIEDSAEVFEKLIGKPKENKDCSANTNRIKEIGNAAKCLTENLKNGADDVGSSSGSNFGDLGKVRTDLENVKGLMEALKEFVLSSVTSAVTSDSVPATSVVSSTVLPPSDSTSSPIATSDSASAPAPSSSDSASSPIVTSDSASAPAPSSSDSAPPPPPSDSTKPPDPSTLSCAEPSSVPTSVLQADVQASILGYCEYKDFETSTACDGVSRDGNWLSNKCVPRKDVYTIPYYYPGVTVNFNVTLVPGTDEYLASSKQCQDALGEVLNGCTPLSGDPLVKYGGSVMKDDGTGNKAFFQLLFAPVEGIADTQRVS